MADAAEVAENGTPHGCAIPQSVFKEDEPGLLYEYSELNAPRSCGVCGDDATYYVFVDGRISKSLCPGCLREAPTVE